MKHLILSAALLLAVSCANTPNQSRKIASAAKDISGNYLGVADYGKGHKGYDKKAVRIYFAPIEGQVDRYNVVLAEYVDLLNMAPAYIVSNKIPFIAKKTGFLKNITSNISVYEAAPGAAVGTYDLFPLIVDGDQIVVNKNAKPRLLTISSEPGVGLLDGATISQSHESEPKEIFFPRKGDKKKTGVQYKTAKLAYKAAKLDSTWRKNWLKGPYLSQYYKKDDVVLKLSEFQNAPVAEFLLNEKMANVPVEKRKKIFTHPDSAFLKGEYTVSEPRDGMFLFHAAKSDDQSKAIIEGKIGLFIDIFDATISLGQDVVELAMIDAENPENFLMYYEHPDNGEGADAGPR